MGLQLPLSSRHHETVNPGFVSPEKDGGSELPVQFLLNAYHLRTIVKSESSQLKHRRKSRTICKWF